MKRVLTLFHLAVTGKTVLLIFSLILVSSCKQMEYDISDGVDKEMTLFSDVVSIPIADIGPLSPKQFLGDVDLGSTLSGLFKVDDEGYFVVEKEETIYSNPVLLLHMGAADPTQPLDVGIDDFTGYPGVAAEGPAWLGFMPALQEFSLYVVNPLTEGMAVSGKLTLLSASEVFNKVPISAASDHFELFSEAFNGPSIIDVCSTENMVLHLPASFLEKDPLGGWSSIAMGYRYKAQLAFGKDLPMQIPIPVNDLDLPLGQFRVKDVLLSTDVVSEIPVTLVLESVDVMVKEDDGEGNVKTVVCDDVSVTPGLSIASGCSGAPVVSPLAIRIKAQEGTIPDIAGLQLNLSVKAPTGEGDKRLNMNQTIRFNKLRVTVSGGITVQGL
ncbi:MAG: hypothetical protein J5478_01215 [Bacteroidales bacterium]|nr:hypothetical protein [Bacteroidales bacterium]